MAARVGARILGRFFGNTVSSAAGFGAGVALGPVLSPPTRLLRNTINAAYPFDPVDPDMAAAIVAEDVEKHDWGATEASYSGIGGVRFDALLGEALNAPGLGELFQMWRRGLINTAGFLHGLRKAKLELRWDGPLEGLRDTLLSSEELANLQQQGFIDPARADEEGGLQGVTPERQQLRFQAAGLPPGWAEGLAMLRRKIITEAEFAEIVRTGHTKTKWTPQLLALRNQVLTAATYAGLALRGWITQADMHAGGLLTGYSPAQMDLLYKEHGRPATGHQVLVGLRRGGVYDGPLTGIPQAFIDAIRQSNIRPEWTNILWHAVVIYPPLFQLTRLVQAGVIDAATAASWSYKSGEAQEVVTELEAYWSQGAAAKADTHASKAQTQLWTTLHRSYLAGESTSAEVSAALPRAGVAAATVPEVLATWDEERTIIRKQLSPAQVKKAYTEGVVNPDTGTPWTKDEATAALVARGYSTADATTFLEL